MNSAYKKIDAQFVKETEKMIDRMRKEHNLARTSKHAAKPDTKSGAKLKHLYADHLLQFDLDL